MSSVVIMTSDFVDLLGILSLTAEKKGEVPEVNGIRLYSTRGDLGEEVGEVDILAGTSTNFSVAGHHFKAVESGDVGDGFFIPLDDATTISKKLSALDKIVEEHVTEVVLDDVDGTITIKEYDNDSGFEYTFPAPDISDYPDDAIEKWVEGNTSPLKDDMGQDLEDGDVLVFNKDSLGAILAVAKKLKVHGVPVLKQHRAAVYPVSIGDDWRGAVLPDESILDQDKDDLETDYYLP